MAWELLHIAQNQLLSPRYNVSLAALNDNQLIVFGGWNNGGRKADGFLIDLRFPMRMVEALSNAGFGNRSLGN